MNYPGYTVTNLRWPAVKDPHPAALPNLDTIVEYMTRHSINGPNSAISAYALAKILNRDVNNTRALLRLRPGFVAVEAQPGKFKYFWLSAFGDTYPRVFSIGLRSMDVPITLTQAEVRPEFTAEPKITNRAANEIVKQLGQTFDYSPTGSDKTTCTARVPYRPLSGANTTNEVRETILAAINSGQFDRAAIILVGIAAAVSKGDLTVTD